MIEIIIFLVVFILSYFGVEKFRQWSLDKQIVDVPNQRSSHAAPKPRGGGLIFVSIALFFYAVLTLFFRGNFEWSYFVGALLVALVSWIDDLFSISFLIRFAVHTFAASIVIWDIGFFREIYLPFFGQTNFGILGAVLTLFWIIWLTNAYNFMDGIDGIAGMQAVTAGLGWFFVGKILGVDELSIYGGILAFSCLGFLIHNWDPARIFMGDVGSAFLGFTFAVLPLLGKRNNYEFSLILPVIAVLLLWLFVFDSVLTFFRRLFKKHKVWEAHREHIYQKLVIKGYSHKFVTILYGLNSAIILGYVVTWLLFGRNFLWLVMLPVAIQSIGILIFGYRKSNLYIAEKNDLQKNT